MSMYRCYIQKSLSAPGSEKGSFIFNFVSLIFNFLNTPSLPATFTQSNNNNVANQIQRLHFSVFFRLSAAKVHISPETAKQFVTFLQKKLSLGL